MLQQQQMPLGWGTAPASRWAAPPRPVGVRRARRRGPARRATPETGTVTSARANPQGRLRAIQSSTSPPTPWRAPSPKHLSQGLAYVGSGQDGHINRRGWRVPRPDRIRVLVPANVGGYRSARRHRVMPDPLEQRPLLWGHPLLQGARHLVIGRAGQADRADPLGHAGRAGQRIAAAGGPADHREPVQAKSVGQGLDVVGPAQHRGIRTRVPRPHSRGGRLSATEPRPARWRPGPGTAAATRARHGARAAPQGRPGCPTRNRPGSAYRPAS